MKKLIYTVVCMMLFCCACSDADIELNPATQAKQQLAMTFRCGAMSPTRAATNDTRIDDINLYLFPVNGGQARHVYIAPVRPVASGNEPVPLRTTGYQPPADSPV